MRPKQFVNFPIRRSTRVPDNRMLSDPTTQPPWPIDQFLAACGFGVGVEILTDSLHKFLGILPEPFTHFIWLHDDTAWNLHWNADVLKGRCPELR